MNSLGHIRNNKSFWFLFTGLQRRLDSGVNNFVIFDLKGTVFVDVIIYLFSSIRYDSAWRRHHTNWLNTSKKLEKRNNWWNFLAPWVQNSRRNWLLKTAKALMSSYSHCKILIFKTPIAQKVFNTRGCHPLGQLIRVPTPFQFSELNFFLSWSQPESLMPMKQTLWKKLSPYSAIKNMRKTGEANYADPLVLLQLFPLSFRLFRDHTKGCLVAAALEFSQGYSARAWTEEKRISSKSLLVCSWGFSGITLDWSRIFGEIWD